jgi:hypothetical protein
MEFWRRFRKRVALRAAMWKIESVLMRIERYEERDNPKRAYQELVSRTSALAKQALRATQLTSSEEEYLKAVWPGIWAAEQEVALLSLAGGSDHLRRAEKSLRDLKNKSRAQFPAIAEARMAYLERLAIYSDPACFRNERDYYRSLQNTQFLPVLALNLE